MRDRWITDWHPSPRFPLCTRANAGEVLPDPCSPLGWSLTWERGCLPGWVDSTVRLGAFVADEFDAAHPETVFHAGGYLFINASFVRIYGERMPGMNADQVDSIYFGAHPDVPPYVAEPWHKRPEKEEGAGAVVTWALEATELPELLEDRARANAICAGRPDLSTLSDSELVARMRSFLPDLRRLFNIHIFITGLAPIGPGILGGIAEGLGDAGLTMRLVAGLGDVDSAAPSRAMWVLSRTVRSSGVLTEAFDAGVEGLLGRLRASGDADAAQFLEGFDAFVAEFGSRGPNEWDIRSHTWETRPEIALAAIDRIRKAPDGDSPMARWDAKVADREVASAQVTAMLGSADDERRAQFDVGMRCSRVFLTGRERTKTTIIKVLNEVRVAAFELGRRHVEAGHLAHARQVTMLLDDEIDAFVARPASFTATLAEREAEYLELFDLEPPFILDTSRGVPPLSQWRRRSAAAGVAKATAGDELVGIAGCPGLARGRARVILDPADPTELEPGDVLIAPITDPAWTPLFVPAAAVVVDTGAQVSHAVIVSRELGLPCVVSVTDATRRIPDGALVEVDGTNGTVRVLEVA